MGAIFSPFSPSFVDFAIHDDLTQLYHLVPFAHLVTFKSPSRPSIPLIHAQQTSHFDHSIYHRSSASNTSAMHFTCKLLAFVRVFLAASCRESRSYTYAPRLPFNVQPLTPSPSPAVATLATAWPLPLINVRCLEANTGLHRILTACIYHLFYP